MNLVKRSANSSDTILTFVHFISWSISPVIVSILLLHIMYRQIHWQNCAYIHTFFFILCIEFLACMITKSATVVHTTQKLQQATVSILLIYCTVMCSYCQGTQESAWTFKKFDIETMPLLSTCCVTITATITSTIITMCNFLKQLIRQK
jgi:hypothetical protein